ncbi:MAG: hypothetical protein ABIH77_04130 [Pseudomonadota bacterium]|nr:chloramphenicol phosphotransferase CPT family protein [Gammaproteobacteria bacterium]MBU1927295.1 chloramphenicol phosphotransferase CPT family protein [Gammaproteobacteria bacterium]
MIFFINGPSSAGKSSIAAAMQAQYSKPLLVVGIDMFLSMMPKQYLLDGEKANEGFQFVSKKDAEGNDVTQVIAGEYGQKVCDMAPNVIRTMAKAGFDIVVDEVLLGDESLKRYVQELHQYPVCFIGIYCELEEIEKREKSRGNRHLGLGRDQMNRVHGPTRIYDVKIDATNLLPDNVAKRIIEFVRETPKPTGFQQLYSTFFPEENRDASCSPSNRRP